MSHHHILERNRRWVEQTTARDPDYFQRLAAEHRPRYLYIGCSDARVAVDAITQTAPGEVFVHRNVANLVVPTDMNLLAVLQYAVEVLRVEDVIVCGHEGCGGVRAAMTRTGAPAHVDNWLANIRTVARLHDEELDALNDERRFARLVELNVVEQVHNLSRTPVIQAAWARGSTLRVHGWVYRLEEGLLRDLHVTLDGQAAADRSGEEHAVAALPRVESREREERVA